MTAINTDVPPDLGLNRAQVQDLSARRVRGESWTTISRALGCDSEVLVALYVQSAPYVVEILATERDALVSATEKAMARFQAMEAVLPGNPNPIGTLNSEAITDRVLGVIGRVKAMEDEIASLTAERNALRASEGTAACRAVVVERLRQIGAEGWSADHDDEHVDGSLVDAAICYSQAAQPGAVDDGEPRIGWPWSRQWWKPGPPIRMLVKAAALLIADIDRRIREGEVAS